MALSSITAGSTQKMARNVSLQCATIWYIIKIAFKNRQNESLNSSKK